MYVTVLFVRNDDSEWLGRQKRCLGDIRTTNTFQYWRKKCNRLNPIAILQIERCLHEENVCVVLHRVNFEMIQQPSSTRIACTKLVQTHFERCVRISGKPYLARVLYCIFPCYNFEAAVACAIIYSCLVRSLILEGSYSVTTFTSTETCS
jgi:hypothetical protein